MDRISNLPSVIIEIILCCLPIQEAGRTSILSREWRYRWIKIPKLTISEATFQVSTDGADLSMLEQEFDTERKRIKIFRRRKFFHAISQLLYLHEGPIHEFTLSVEIDAYCDEIDHILSQVAQRNTVKNLKLHFEWVGTRLPISLFLFRQLTDLCLEGCCCVLLDLSNCRFLRSLTMAIGGCYRLKSDNEYSSIINLFECLPVVETLSIPLGYYIIQSYYPSVHDRIPRELPTALIHLKYLTIDGVSFRHRDVFFILVLLIKRSPNLEKLKIDNRQLDQLYDRSTEDEFSAYDDLFTDDGICSFSPEDYADMWLEHLTELQIRSFENKGNELNFVKLILAKSPVLKKVRIYHELALNELMQITEVLFSFPCASTVVDINVRQMETNYCNTLLFGLLLSVK